MTEEGGRERLDANVYELIRRNFPSCSEVGSGYTSLSLLPQILISYGLQWFARLGRVDRQSMAPTGRMDKICPAEAQGTQAVEAC